MWQAQFLKTFCYQQYVFIYICSFCVFKSCHVHSSETESLMCTVNDMHMCSVLQTVKNGC